MRQFKIEMEYVEQTWIARCNELHTTLGGTSFDALIERMRIVIQDIAEVELGHKGDIQLTALAPTNS